MVRLATLAFFLIGSFTLQAQCLVEKDGIIWKGNDEYISFKSLAEYAAPMLWFSPDEILLYDENEKKQLPNPFPFDDNETGPIVYYKFRTVYGLNKLTSIKNPESLNPDLKVLDLTQVKAIDLDYMYYFLEEFGTTGHLHDIESVMLQIRVIETVDCPEYKYAIVVTRVTGRAHGNQWYNNSFNVKQQTFFPLSILIEEGKHASCTDKNADGVYTPTFDVTERINDAWGVRDIITSGRLVTGRFQAWMAKTRTKSSIVFPPLPKNSIHYRKYEEKFGDYIEGSQYKLKPYPNYKELKEANKISSNLDRFMRHKKPHIWPSFQKVSRSANVKQWIKEKKKYNSLSLAYRWDDAQQIGLAFPLFLLKNVEAPKTGGWIYNKLYFGDFGNVIRDANFDFEKLLGHQITYSSSASNWIDAYFGLGYEIFDTGDNTGRPDYKTFFVSEAGIKFRVNIAKTPIRFLRYLGTDFWGIRLGWKNVGFSPFVESGFVIEIGAGVF